MAECFTGFWEAEGPAWGPEVTTTISYWPVEELLEHLRQRLEQVPPGTHVRIDLVAWDGS